MTSANKSLEKKNFHRLRLEQLLRIFRALQTSRVLHISMDARLRINQLLSIQVQCVKKHCWPNRGKIDLRACPREHRAVVLHAISPISMKLCQFEGSSPKLKKTNCFLFCFFPGGDRPPPPRFFLGLHQGNRFKIGKMYEALTVMVFNQLF